MRTLLLILLILLGGRDARADQWPSPSTLTLTSPNRRWSAVIVPATDGKGGARATLGPAQGPLTTITLQDPWMPVDAVLLDDGTLLTLDHWHRLGYGKVAMLYERDGKVRWSKTLVELIGQATADLADHSVSSIWWRKRPLEWALTKDGKSGLITLFDENQLQLAFADGRATIVATKLPDDPARQLNRARSLARQDGQASAALTLLDQLLAKQPENFEAAGLYVEVAQRVGDHALAVAMLDKLAPRWKAATTGGYGFANLAVAWATSLVAVSRTADAERVLRQALAAVPTYANPVLALATLLYDGKRKPEADRALDDFLANALKASYVDTYAITSIGGFYRQHQDLPRALATYQKGYKPTEVTNQFLYANLAETYEALGKLADAIRIHEQLLAYFQRSKLDSFTKQTEAELVRLRAKR